MIYKAFNSLFFGLLMILPLDFLFFIGIKLNYFDAYKIDEYFNIYFIDNQPYIYIVLTSIIVGALWLYSPLKRVVQAFYLFALIAFFSMLYEPIAGEVGREMFMKPNVKCQLGSYKFTANILYEGRTNYYLKRDNIIKTIKIPKKDLVINSKP